VQATSLDALRAVTDQQLVIGAHVVDLGSLRVTSGTGQPKLTPKAASVLLELARRAGQTVTHDDLLDRVWAGTCPTRNVLTQAIKELRRALDGHDPDSCIRTIPKIGYRLVVPAALEEPASPVPNIPVPDGCRIIERSPSPAPESVQRGESRESASTDLHDYAPMAVVLLVVVLILIIGAPYFG